MAQTAFQNVTDAFQVNAFQIASTPSGIPGPDGLGLTGVEVCDGETVQPNATVTLGDV
jgi:hypothetical protein